MPSKVLRRRRMRRRRIRRKILQGICDFMYYVYVLRSLSYNTYYVGSTENAEKRLSEHNSGKCRYTSGRMLWKLVYKEDYQSRSEAMKREKFLKSGQGRKLLKEILLVSSLER